MRLLMYAALLAAGIAVAFWLMQSRQDARRRDDLGAGSGAGRTASGEVMAGDEVSPVQRRSRARMIYGPEAGPGWLTLYSTQLVFTGQSGRVVVTERIDIHGATTSQQLPDRNVARPALVVATATEALFFEVDDPAGWTSALL